MAVTAINAPRTVETALTTNYLANDYEITGTRKLEIWLDDATLGFTVRLQSVGGAQIERAVTATERYFYLEVPFGSKMWVNVKAASGTPNVQFYIV